MGEEIGIVWDGDVVLAVDKPAGLAVQAPPGIESVESRLKRRLADRAAYLAFPHRLDRPVSGLLLVALRKRAARLLSDQFASRKVRKIYVAEISGRPTGLGPQTPRTWWRDWVRKIEDQPKAEICGEHDAAARLAETEVEWLRHDAESDTSLLRLMPVTGRMHQLRVQAAARGYPIRFDQLYGSTEQTGRSVQTRPCASDRIHLHAESLEFHDPRNGVRVKVEVACAFGG